MRDSTALARGYRVSTWVGRSSLLRVFWSILVNYLFDLLKQASHSFVACRHAEDACSNLIDHFVVLFFECSFKLDDDGVTLDYVYLEDGRMVNQEIIRNGYSQPLSSGTGKISPGSRR